MVKGSYQIFTDTNTKVLKNYGEKMGNDQKGVFTEKIENIMGSSAGAGSGEFHMYLGARNREAQRLSDLELRSKEDEERKHIAEKVSRNREEAIKRTEKNSQKRKRMKEKKNERRIKHKKSQQNNEDDVKSDNDSVEEKETV